MITWTNRFPLSLALVALLVGNGCYLSHGIDAERDGGTDTATSDRTVQTDARVTDARLSDTRIVDVGPMDAGPPPPLRDPQWTPLAETELRPPPRMNHLAVYDHENDRMLVWGGFDPYHDRGADYIEHRDLWAYRFGVERWEKLADLERSALAFNPLEAVLDGDRVVFLATESSSGGSTETWEMRLPSGTLRTLPRGPWPRRDSPLRSSYNSATRELIVQDSFFTEVARGMWAFNLDTNRWRELESSDAPPRRFHTPLTVTGLTSSGSNQAFLFGGFGFEGDWERAELWRFQESRWTQIPLTGPSDGRWSHRAVYEPLRHTLVVFGGQRGTLNRGTLLIDIAAAEAREIEFSDAPGARRDFSLVLDSRRRRAVAFGGAFQSERVYSDTWALRLP